MKINNYVKGLITGALMYASANAANAADYRVLDRDMNVRSSPEVRADNKIGKQKQGSTIDVIEEIKGKKYTWMKVKDVTGDGVDDYIAKLKPRAPKKTAEKDYRVETIAEFSDDIGNIPKDNKKALEKKLEKEGLFRFIEENGYKAEKSGVAGYTASVIASYNKDAKKKGEPEFKAGFGRVDYEITSNDSLVAKVIIPRAGKEAIKHSATVGYKLDKTGKAVKKKKQKKEKKDKKPSTWSLIADIIQSYGGEKTLTGVEVGIAKGKLGVSVGLAKGSYDKDSVLSEETITGTRFDSYGKATRASDVDVKEISVNARVGPMILGYCEEVSDSENKDSYYEAIKDKNGNVLASNNDAYVSEERDKKGKFRLGLEAGLGKGWHINASTDLSGNKDYRRTSVGIGRKFSLKRQKK